MKQKYVSVILVFTTRSSWYQVCTGSWCTHELVLVKVVRSTQVNTSISKNGLIYLFFTRYRYFLEGNTFLHNSNRVANVCQTLVLRGKSLMTQFIGDDKTYSHLRPTNTRQYTTFGTIKGPVAFDLQFSF